MNKNLLFLVACAAFVSAVSCNKNEEVIDDNSNEEVGVLIAEVPFSTKTATSSDFKVNWTAGDALAVYTWPSGTELPSDAGVWRSSEPVVFTTSEGSGNLCKFSLASADVENTLAELPYEDRLSAFKARFAKGENLEWGVIYPGRMANGSRPGMGIVVFGDEQHVDCSQKGNNNTDHLAQQDVLYGRASKTLTPVVKMHHVGTMMEYTIRNTGETPFVVNAIKIKVTSAVIGGQFRYNVMEGKIDSDMTQIHECPLYVSEGESIPVGGEAKFYQILAPFTLDEGKTAQITVSTDKGMYTKTITAEGSIISFISGQRSIVDVDVAFSDSGEGGDKEGDLVQHDIPQFKFGGSNLGCYFNLSNAAQFTWPCPNDEQKNIDMVIFRGSGQTALVFASPTDSGLQDWIDNSIKEWSKINLTYFKIIDENFDSIKSSEALALAYERSPSNGDIRATVKKDVVVAAKTESGEYALIKVTDAEMNGTTWSGFTLSFKTTK